MSPASKSGVWGNIDAYRDWPNTAYPPVAIGIPERYGVPPRVLEFWRRKGWLGAGLRGSGSRFPWTDPQIAAQVDWLKRLIQSGRNLDDEDAAAGFRLRSSGATLAIRVGTWPWEAVTIDALTFNVDEAYALAEVTR